MNASKENLQLSMIQNRWLGLSIEELEQHKSRVEDGLQRLNSLDPSRSPNPSNITELINQSTELLNILDNYIYQRKAQEQ